MTNLKEVGTLFHWSRHGLLKISLKRKQNLFLFLNKNWWCQTTCCHGRCYWSYPGSKSWYSSGHKKNTGWSAFKAGELSEASWHAFCPPLLVLKAAGQLWLTCLSVCLFNSTVTWSRGKNPIRGIGSWKQKTKINATKLCTTKYPRGTYVLISSQKASKVGCVMFFGFFSLGCSISSTFWFIWFIFLSQFS